ncbi:hypothetical protein [Magnetospirillum molischianum]|uniref:Transposase n=1 Tax=Magnetospirillum molischianum DSM 120 TaxID=1150626 RepID=H8FWP9_MAGML|nr:hypothetical protein [Magnetospirillum molischianum]CCG42787.1 hypothetical protein PHAMO_470038 [Magnetospirillum molischianum DSM 120]
MAPVHVMTSVERRRRWNDDVILSILARRHQPPVLPSVITPNALRLTIESLADCGRYDSLWRVA